MGEIENVITADYIYPHLQIISSVSPVTDNQRERIIKVIAKAKENNGWDISRDNKFFLVKQLYRTEFRKQSKGSMRGKQYFDLEEVLNNPKLPDVAQIAEILNTKYW
ncbi:MAG: hypothetical protein HS114_11080 [Anaerolineales bacterium]|nr:hypothetical protein [Anaerolineales bacterium]